MSRLVHDAVEQILGDEVVECRGGQAGFYYYLTLGRTETRTESDFFRYLARTTGRRDVDGGKQECKPRVVYIPGEYCVHPDGVLIEVGRRQLCLSYSFEEPERILEALTYMREAIDFATNQQTIERKSRCPNC